MATRADIKTGYSCNNNCIHCVASDKRNWGDMSTEKYKKEMEAARKEGAIEIVITGGEPTIRRDFIELVNYANSLGFSHIFLQSNGRMFCNKEFASSTISAGKISFSIALHAHKAEIHDAITRTRGSFDQTVEGLKNLVGLGVGNRIKGVIVITKFNYKILPEITEFMISLGLESIQLDMVHPSGNAYKYYDEVVPRLSETIPYIRKSMEIAENVGINTLVEAVPFCLLGGYEDHAIELRIPDVEIREIGSYTPNFNALKLKHSKTKGPGCHVCKYYKICEGLWREYPERMGFDELKPVKGRAIERKEELGYFNGR